ncbi:hypothetical protein HZS_2862 [Henneguya salminicola]|nr:hypothetical protein HZS_2862 [Henneguya salminicola]
MNNFYINYNGFSYQKNNKSGNIIYYRWGRSLTDNISTSLYSNSIFQELPLTLWDKTLRKTQDLSSVERVTSPPTCYKENKHVFLGGYGKVTNETPALLKYNSHVFIDSIARSTCKDFSQYIVLMTFDLGSQTFVPCDYALVTSEL